MVSVSRSASHSGSWYSSNPVKLGKQIDRYLSDAPGTVSGARVLIGPHAGYAYAGPTLAETYKAWDNSNVKRIFILGPSHHIYFKNLAYVSGVDVYETPFGNLPVDKEIVTQLTKSHKDIFKIMDLEVDEDEHSFEMHAPFIYKLCENLPQGLPSIIPIMISHTDEKFNEHICELLVEYFKDPSNHFVISSDFCHWGSRFGFTKYSPTANLDDLSSIGHISKISKDHGVPIYKSIEYLDKFAMKIASTGSSKSWRDYIKVTGNTICGQKPLLLVLKIMEIVKKQKNADDENYGKFKWIGYTQSSKVMSPADSSVSYASGYVVA